jgi:rhodanese-related sulfurtransferase
MQALFIAIGLLLNTGSFTSTESTSFVMEQDAKTIKRVSQEEFRAYLKEHPNVQLIDVRTPGEFEQGTIDGARNIDFFNANFKAQISELDKDVPTLIFCKSGGRSAKALQMFKAEGFDFVLELEGGYSNWK